MTPVPPPADGRTEALILEQARVFAQALLRATRQAPDGQVLAQAEQVALGEGRAFLRQALQAALEAEGPALEKRGPRPGPVRADTAGT
jgi:hypothetical protein